MGLIINHRFDLVCQIRCTEGFYQQAFPPVVRFAGALDTSVGSSFAGRGRWPGIRSTGEVCHVETYDMVRTVSVLDAMMVV